MFKKSLLLLLTLIFFLAPITNAQQKKELGIKEMEFCTAVENRQPVGTDKEFYDTVEKVYCFTKIIGAADTTTVSHVWYHNDEEKARVELPVKSKSWRTWSSKIIIKEWGGVWRVDILSSGGKLLISKEFLIKPTEE